MLNNLRLLLDIHNYDQDDTLLAILELCKSEFCSYCRRTDWDKHEDVITAMAVYKYNSLGNEGLKSEDYSGVNFSYDTDYSAPIQRQLRNLRKLQCL